MLSTMEQLGQCVELTEDVYGWVDRVAQSHIVDRTYTLEGKATDTQRCSWVLPLDAVVEESSMSKFENTFDGNSTEIVVNASPASCACGLYAERTLRYQGDFDSFLFRMLQQ